MKRVSLSLTIGIHLGVSLAAGSALAQNLGLVMRDGTLGAAPAGVVAPGVDPAGRPASYLIRAELGEQAGSSLFHSFDRFGIGPGETATFIGPDPIGGPQTVSNIVSRVTGGEASSIQGTLRSTVPGADVYLLNPAGVMFERDARLDVQGAFHATTADRLDYGDGTYFSAQRGGALPILATAEPAAFGFLGDATQRIEVREAVLDNPAGLELAAGSVAILDGAEIATGNILDAGDITVRATDEVVLAGTGSSGTGSSITTSSVTGTTGSVRLEGARVRLADGASVSANRFLGGGAPVGITITAHEQIEIVGRDRAGNPSQVLAATAGAQPSGDVVLDARTLHMADGAQISTDSSGSAAGPAGRIRVGSGDPRGVEHIALSGRSVISSRSGSGEAGSVMLRAGAIELDGGSGVGASSASGSGGDIRIEARDGVHLSGAAADGAPSFVTASTISGAAGSIAIDAGRVVLEDGAQIAANTFLSDDTAGTVSVVARERVEVAGHSPSGAPSSISAATGAADDRVGSIAIEAPLLWLHDGGVVSARTFGAGAGGSILVDVRELRMERGALIEATSSRAGSGAPGTIAVGFAGGRHGTERIALSGGSEITTRSAASPQGGAIELRARGIELRDGASVASDTAAATGRGGDVRIAASDTVVLSGIGDGGFTVSAAAEPGSGADGGSVRIEAARLLLENGAVISTSTSGAGEGGEIALDVRRLHAGGASRIEAVSDSERVGAGRAGDIRIGLADGRYRSREVVFTEGSELRTDALASDGGNVAIASGRLLRLEDSAISANVRAGEGGNIDVAMDAVVLQQSEILARAGAGRGGAIAIAADAFVADSASTVDASAGDPNLSGSVLIQSPDVDLAGTLARLPDTTLDGAGLLRDACAAHSPDAPGSFVVEPLRGGGHATPDRLLAAPSLGVLAASASLPGPPIESAPLSDEPGACPLCRGAGAAREARGAPCR